MHENEATQVDKENLREEEKTMIQEWQQWNRTKRVKQSW